MSSHKNRGGFGPLDDCYYQRPGFEIVNGRFVWRAQPDYPVQMLVSANWVPFRSTPSPTVNVELRVAGGHLVKPDEPGPTVFFPARLVCLHGQTGQLAWTTVRC